MAWKTICDCTAEELKNILKEAGRDYLPDFYDLATLRYLTHCDQQEGKRIRLIDDTAGHAYDLLSPGSKILMKGREYIKAVSTIEHAEDLLVDLETGLASRSSSLFHRTHKAEEVFTISPETTARLMAENDNQRIEAEYLGEDY